jgi:hypothetical protein
VGDDAEYMREIQAQEEAAERLVLQSRMDAHCKPVLTWIEGELEDVWDWYPATRVLDVFGRLHRESGLGTAAFASVGVPTVDEVGRGAVGNFQVDASGANYEVVILSHADAGVLDSVSTELQRRENRLSDRILGEMLDAILEFIESHPEQRAFVFARAL